MSTSRKPQGIKGSRHQSLRSFGQRTALPHHTGFQLRITVNPYSGISRLLDSSCAIDPLANDLRTFSRLALAQLFIRNAVHLHMQIDPIQHRTGNPLAIISDTLFGTIAPTGRMTVITAFAGIHGPYQHKLTGIGKGAGNAGNRYNAIFQRLTQYFHRVTFEFRQLVQEQNAVVRQGNLTRFGMSAAAAGHTGRRDRMVRAAERTIQQHGCFTVQQTSHRIDLAAFQRLFKSHIGQNGGQAFGQHTLTAARRAEHQNMVRSGCGDLQGPLDGFLPHHISKIRAAGPVVYKEKSRLLFNGCFTRQMLGQLQYTVHRIDAQSLYHTGLCRIFSGNIQTFHTGIPSRKRHRQHTGRWSDFTFQR